jgi:hypothetical protein
MIGRGEGRQLAIAPLLDPFGALPERRCESLSTGCSFQRRGQGGRAHAHPRGERLLDQAHALRQGEASPLAAASLMQVPNQGVEGMGGGVAH